MWIPALACQRMTDEPQSDLLTEIASDCAEVRAMLRAEVRARDLPYQTAVPLKLIIIREALLHRVSDMADGARAMFEERRAAPAVLLVRAAMETTALMHRLVSKLREGIAATSATDLEALTMDTLFANRIKGKPHPAASVLTTVKKLGASFGAGDGLLEQYEALSEWAHPNWAGVMQTYSRTVDPSPPPGLSRRAVVTFGRSLTDPNDAVGMHDLRVALGCAVRDYREIEDLLPRADAIVLATLRGGTPGERQ